MTYFDSMAFISTLAKVSSSLSKYLGENFIPHYRQGSMVGRHLHELIELNNKHKFQELEWSFTLISALNDELKLIYDKDPSIVKKLALLHKAYANVKRSKNVDLLQHNQITETKYYGFRCEVHVASQLIKYSIEFEKRETPDYLIRFKGKELQIECTSAHVYTYNKKVISLDKLSEVLNSKLSNPHYDKKTAVVINITNIMHNLGLMNSLPTEDELIEVVYRELSRSSIGAVLVYFYILNKEKMRISPIYIHVKGKEYEYELIELLNTVFPPGDEPVSDYLIPKAD